MNGLRDRESVTVCVGGGGSEPVEMSGNFLGKLYHLFCWPVTPPHRIRRDPIVSWKFIVCWWGNLSSTCTRGYIEVVIEK